MRKGIAAVAGTALALGVLAGAPVAMARQGADDGLAPSALDHNGGLRPAGLVPTIDDNGGASATSRRTDVRVTRSCSVASRAKLKLSPDNGRVEVEFEVDENRVGSRWSVILKRNGTQVATATARTLAPSGSFDVLRVVSAGSPRTTVVATATRAATGETCRVSATL